MDTNELVNLESLLNYIELQYQKIEDAAKSFKRIVLFLGVCLLFIILKIKNLNIFERWDAAIASFVFLAVLLFIADKPLKWLSEIDYELNDMALGRTFWVCHCISLRKVDFKMWQKSFKFLYDGLVEVNMALELAIYAQDEGMLDEEGEELLSRTEALAEDMFKNMLYKIYMIKIKNEPWDKN